MRKFVPLALALAFVLGGCGPHSEPAPSPEPSPALTVTPTPDLTSRTLQATWLEVDEDRRFWVELRETDEPSPITDPPFVDNGSAYIGLRVDIYNSQEDREPVQSFLTGYDCEPGSLAFSPGDWDFDGYNDLAFTNTVVGSRCSACDFYLWDPGAEQFIPDPYGLNELNYPNFYPKDQVITSFYPITGDSETYRHYRYEDGELVLSRECQKLLDFETGIYSYSVEGLVDGTWQTLFQGEGDHDSPDYDEYYRWLYLFRYHTDPYGFSIDDTHDAFEVGTGGRLGTVLVTVELLEESREDGHAIHLQVWNPGDLRQPLQELDSYTCGIFHSSDVVDANFDGHMDFGYMYAMGNQPCYWHYWIWDESKGQFVAEPEFDQISCPIFDPETQTIEGWMRSSCCSNEQSLYRWEEGKLICFRKVEVTYPDEDFNQEKVVYELVDGELTEVSREPYQMLG